MIDDRIGLAASRSACWLDIYITVRIVCALGFHLGLPKCILWPQRRLRYLGMMLHLDTLCCSVPDQKLQKFVQAVDDVVQMQCPTARQLASVAGMLISFAVAVPLGKLYTKSLFEALSGKQSWDQVLPLGVKLREHLLWLRAYVLDNNGHRWFKRRPGVILITDAAVKGAGGLAVAPVLGVSVHCRLTCPNNSL